MKPSPSNHDFNKTQSLDEIEKYKELSIKYEKEIIALKNKNKDLENSLVSRESSNTHISMEGLETLLLRIGPEQSIEYINTQFCRKFNTTKENLIGQNYQILKKIMDINLFEAIDITEGESYPQIVHDKNNLVYDIKISIKDGFTDIIFQDISNEHKFKQYVSRYVSSELDRLSDDDLKTFKYPERRFMTVSFTDLRGFTNMSEELSPEEVRVSINAYLEEIIHAIDENLGTVDKIHGDEVMALYGAPKYYEDHALRAIKTCCDQIFNLKALQKVFKKLGKNMPDCGIGINSGDMVIGNMGSSSRQDYTVLGNSVNIAARLCGVASGLEIIITEDTLHAALRVLPENWGYSVDRKNNNLGSSTVEGQFEGIFALPDHLENKKVSIGPKNDQGEIRAQFIFHYLYAIKVKGIKDPLPIISVEDKRAGRGELYLNNHKLLQGQGELIFGKYRLIELIGRGGMGEVYKAKDSFGNLVALKMLIAGEGASQRQIKRFKQEATILAKLQHRSICRIYEIGEIDNTTYIAMEYIEGISLSELLKTKKTDAHSNLKSKSQSVATSIDEIIQDAKSNSITEEPHPEENQIPVKQECNLLPFSISIPLIIEICEAAEYAHNNGILHRDLKPANIMLRSDGRPVLMDFGLAKMEIDEQQNEASMSLSGQILGTIDTMSPEQALSSKDVNETSDVYSIGAILYQMITGKKHFEASGNLITDANTLQHHVAKRPKLINNQVDTDLEVITLKALRPETNDRYKRVVDLKNDLQRYKLGQVITAKDANIFEVTRKLIKRNRSLSFVIACSLIFSFGMVAYTMISINIEKIEAQNALAKLEKEQLEKSLIQGESAVKYYEIAKNKLIIGDIGDAFYHIKRAIEFEPEDIDYKLFKCYIAIANNNHIKAWRTINNLNTRFPEHEQVSILYNIGLENNQRYDNILNSEHRKFLENLFFKLERPDLAKRYNSISEMLPNYIEYLKKKFPEIENMEKRVSYNYNKTWLHVKFNRLEKIGDLKGLKNLPIYSLNLFKSNISTIHDLEGLKIRDLNLSYCPVSNIKILKDLPLRKLNLDYTKVKDLSPLKEVPLNYLSVSGTYITDLSPLKGTKIKTLYINSTYTEDISHLHGLPIEDLWLSDTNIRDLSPLKGMPIKHLWMDNTYIKDISVLKGMAIQNLDIRSTYVEDISTLKGMPLHKLCITPKQFNPGWQDILVSNKSIAYLSTKNNGQNTHQTVDKFWEKVKAGEYTSKK